LAALQDESVRRTERVLELRSRAGELALEVARGAVEIEALQHELRETASLTAAGQRRDQLRRLEQCVLSDGLNRALRDALAQAKALRFAWALQAFRLHCLDVHPADPADRNQLRSGRMKHARGIGKIGGLPLPHAGPELFGVLPPPELESALRLVASLTSLLARCLNVALPHPIRLRHDTTPEALDPQQQDILNAVRRDLNPVPSTTSKESSATGRSDRYLSSKTIGNISELMSSSTASLASLLRGGVSKANPSSVFGRAVRVAVPSTSAAAVTALPTLPEEISFEVARPTLSVTSLSTDPVSVRLRVESSRAAMIAEDWGSETSSWYRLSTGGGGDSVSAAAEEAQQDEFLSALQLLQDDLIALCIRSGVPVDRLWPAEALLLNLDELHRHCREQVTGRAAS
jgi:hypothetical protein